jgi:hypothetical protein
LADDRDHGDSNEGRFKHSNLENGTLGWAEYGLYPGLYGFSLRWHLGYGYGLYALGVGADGGYPFSKPRMPSTPSLQPVRVGLTMRSIVRPIYRSPDRRVRASVVILERFRIPT